MRPKTILWFETLYLGSLAIAVVKIAVEWRETRAALPTHFILAVLAFSLILTTALVLLVSRRRSRVAKWVMAVLYALGLTAYLPIFRTGVDSAGTAADIGLGVMQVAALVLLFSPSARAWLSAEREADASAGALERTFE
jgi:NADH:ubiquinone oxidoreductase subunit K